MGEGWSDWYAKDYIVGQFPAIDTGTPGEIEIGAYTDSVPHTIRAQAIDCPVGALGRGPARRRARAGPGGFTYGDFGRIAAAPEVHADGEIWAQTLWDLRARGRHRRSARAAGHRRHAAVAARADVPGHAQRDPARRPGAGRRNRTQIWAVFAARGMG